ncbi:hypothetical protein BKA65DRAFT_565006 [Rhexocercosporidium sp. MPI-PUGE-AT-0058]|nr:hypothetical protein BKA65DRAFT_565006 [Rhexocercosporidium sp. MPI-PUGE-AT-0058]
MPHDLLLVLATMGQRLLSLEVIDHAALPEARRATREAFAACGAADDDIGDDFAEADEIVQYAVTCAMVFCAECWPGFGAGLFNYLYWVNPVSHNMFCEELNNAIAALKTRPHSWTLLTKSPSRVSQTEPFYEQYDKSQTKVFLPIMKDVIKEFEKRGFPQPKAPHSDVEILNWYIPFATWAGTSMYENLGHSVVSICSYQNDPGRFFYAWTAGKRADLLPGEAVMFTDEHTGYLAKWLEGLNGMTHKTILDSEVDYSKLKFKSSTSKFLKKHTGHELGIQGIPMIMVLNTSPRVSLADQFQKLQVTASVTSIPQAPPATPSSPPAYTTMPISPSRPGSQPPGIKRRLVPMPPLAALRKVVATHAFSAIEEGELSFEAGAMLEILKDDGDDGWWKARLDGRVGMIPSTFVQ